MYKYRISWKGNGEESRNEDLGMLMCNSRFFLLVDDIFANQGYSRGGGRGL